MAASLTVNKKRVIISDLRTLFLILQLVLTTQMIEHACNNNIFNEVASPFTAHNAKYGVQ